MKLFDIPKHWQAVIDADPNSVDAQRYLGVQKKIRQENTRLHIATTVDVKSQVGTILSGIFERRVGAVPCSACRRLIMSLNKMSGEQIRGQMDSIVQKIEENAQKTRRTWWAKILTHIDAATTGGVVTRHLIRKWLEEACETDERNNTVADNVLGDNQQPPGVDRRPE